MVRTGRAQIAFANPPPRPPADIPHCSLARWFSTLFDAENTLVALEIHDPSEEYVLADYADAGYNQLVRGTRVESQNVAWIYRNRETGHMVRTRGTLRAIMTPDFVEGVLKMERLDVYYQLSEEYIPRQVHESAGVSVSPGGEADREEQVAGFEAMVRRRNVKIADMPPPLGPYGVSEQVLRFLEVSTCVDLLASLTLAARDNNALTADTHGAELGGKVQSTR